MRLSIFSFALACSFLAACTLSAQTSGDDRQEFAVTIGSLSGNNPATPAGTLTLGSNVAFEANYAHRFSDTKQWASLYWEINALASPFRHLSGSLGAAASNIRSVYVTPGVRLQFAPEERFTPWLDGGAGYGFYDASGTSISGGVTGGGATAPSGTTNTYAVDFGGGVDFVVNKRYTIRGAVQGFYTGSPNYGVVTTSGQFNFVISGGIVWRLGK